MTIQDLRALHQKGPSFSLGDVPNLYVTDIESLERSELDWTLVCQGKEYKLSTEELDSKVPGLSNEYLIAIDNANPSADVTFTAIQQWLQQHYLNCWQLTPANEVFKIWHMIDLSNFTNMPTVDSTSLASIFPTMQVAIELGLSLTEQHVAIESYRRKPAGPVVTMPDEFGI